MVYIIKIFNCRTQTETYKHFSKGILCSQLLILPIKISKKNSKKRNFQRTPPEKKTRLFASKSPFCGSRLIFGIVTLDKI